jgi:hypothetical protein
MQNILDILQSKNIFTAFTMARQERMVTQFRNALTFLRNSNNITLVKVTDFKEKF